MSGPHRLARLDGLRGIAAFGVALHHLFLHYADWPYATGAVLATWLRDWGWTFVDLFFVLSGYVFAHVYLAGESLRGRRGLADFAVARIARLYPLHLVMLLVVALFVYGSAHNGPLEFAANLLMLQALLHPFAQSFNQPSWSLSVEALCYLVFALGAHAGPGALARLSGWIIALSALYLALFGRAEIADALPRGFLGFFVGQALWHGRERLARVPSWLLSALLVAGVAGLALPVSPSFPLTLCAWPAALLLALRLPLMEARPLLWLGDRSYAVYLINLPLIFAAGALLGRGGGLAAQLGIVAALLLASEASFRLIEAPARRAIRAVWARRSLRLAPA